MNKNKTLYREIAEFANTQKLNIIPEMIILWEYKFLKTVGNRDSLFNILKNDNVYLRMDKKIKSISEFVSDEFFFVLELYKEDNIKLAKFCNKILNGI